MAKKPSRRIRGGHDAQVDLTSLMDIFSNILMFIILSSVFVKAAVIDIHLPKPGGGITGDQIIKVLTLKVDEKGLKSGGNLGVSYPFIPVVNGKYNYSRLLDNLKEIKAKHREHSEIVLLFKDSIKYEKIVKIIDVTREELIVEDGEQVSIELFPNVSLGEYQGGETEPEKKTKK